MRNSGGAFVTFGVLALAALTFAPPAVAADGPGWPQFHGPRRDNISKETGLPKSWPDGGPKLLWTAQGIGHGFASVSVADGLIYTAGNAEEKTRITAIDLDGRTRWTFDNGKAWTGSHPGSRGVPTIDGGRLYHESPLGNVVCLNAKTGRKIWGLNILERFGAKNTIWALAESLLIDGDRVICCPGGPETAMVALDKMTGRVVWKSPSTGDKAGYASPTLAEQDGLRMIFTMTARALIAVNADNGELLWRFEHVTPYNENIFVPLYHDGHVFISTQTTGSVKLRICVDGRKASVEPVWRSTELDNHHGGVVLLDGHLYGSCARRNGAQWVCLDWEAGQVKYIRPGVGKGSLTYADGMLYTFAERHTMGLVRVTPEGHEVVSRFDVPARGKALSWAHPVVCGGRLYIRESDRLYAYQLRDD